MEVTRFCVHQIRRSCRSILRHLATWCSIATSTRNCKMPRTSQTTRRVVHRVLQAWYVFRESPRLLSQDNVRTVACTGIQQHESRLRDLHVSDDSRLRDLNCPWDPMVSILRADKSTSKRPISYQTPPRMTTVYPTMGDLHANGYVAISP